MRRKGYVLISVMIFIGVFFIAALGLMRFVNAELNMSRHQLNSTKAFFLAEAGVERAIAQLRDTGSIQSALSFSISETGLTGDASGLDNIVIDITAVDKGNNVYEVTSSAAMAGSTRTIKADLEYTPPSEVFDYAYFLNNWGWFYGSGITANGDVRSNGRFDFKYGPTIEGEVYAGQDIGGGEDVNGKAGTVVDGEYIYQHPFSPVLDMPNLQSLGYYESLAKTSGSTIKIGGSVLVSGVFGDDAGESGNIVLVGTPANPIEINGPVVVTGDVVISGTVEGQGTLYAGRNIYAADNIQYKNGPTSPRPPSDDPDAVDAWVNANIDKDIVGFAASESVILGDYTSNGWLADNWLFSMGSEDVGMDGIPATGDTGELDGVFQPLYEDLDKDAVFDHNYGWSDVQTATDITNFSNLPPDVTTFGDIATNDISKLEGVFYTNHAFAGMGNSLVVNGTVISKDEAIVAYNNITMNYDERVHSKYKANPNWLIDLQLPFSDRVRVIGWREQ